MKSKEIMSMIKESASIKDPAKFSGILKKLTKIPSIKLTAGFTINLKGLVIWSIRVVSR